MTVRELIKRLQAFEHQDLEVYYADACQSRYFLSRIDLSSGCSDGPRIMDPLTVLSEKEAKSWGGFDGKSEQEPSSFPIVVIGL